MRDFIITGDCHGSFSRLNRIPHDSNIVILGDSGINFIEEYQYKNKKILSKLNNDDPDRKFYILHGNHDRRPETLPNIKEEFDEEVKGNIYYEEEFPNIRYFKQFGEYEMNGYKVLAIGGAYSVDKFYRLTTGKTWYDDEQLTDEEKVECMEMAQDKSYDLVITHTCPTRYVPTDLFLPSINQNSVDHSMEEWLEELAKKIDYSVWAFGHYHDNRIISRNGVLIYDGHILLEDLININSV